MAKLCGYMILYDTILCLFAVGMMQTKISSVITFMLDWIGDIYVSSCWLSLSVADLRSHKVYFPSNKRA
jgi:hypothetical protein